jgi:hypothetical protein
MDGLTHFQGLATLVLDLAWFDGPNISMMLQKLASPVCTTIPHHMTWQHMFKVAWWCGASPDYTATISKLAGQVETYVHAWTARGYNMPRHATSKVTFRIASFLGALFLAPKVAQACRKRHKLAHVTILFRHVLRQKQAADIFSANVAWTFISVQIFLVSFFM